MGKPTAFPTTQPSSQPSSQPSRQPLSRPTGQPSRQPTSQPSSQPTRLPTCQPTRQPSSQPSRQPTRQPTSQPSRTPTVQPSGSPTAQPSTQPTSQPTSIPTALPTAVPSGQPSSKPTMVPFSVPTGQPTSKPSSVPTAQPTRIPSAQPSSSPTLIPTADPTSDPTSQPTSRPSRAPSAQPTAQPTAQPLSDPTSTPTSKPSHAPVSVPTTQPSRQPTEQPTGSPTTQPTSQPTSDPSAQPVSKPSSIPTSSPSKQPVSKPTGQPTGQPTSRPSGKPTVFVSVKPTPAPSNTPVPTQSPTTSTPTAAPTVSLANRWKALLEMTLKDMGKNDSSDVVERVNYYGSDNLVGLIPSTLQGGCTSWKYAIDSKLTVSSYSYVASSVQMVYYTSPSDLASLSTATCSGKTEATSIMQALVSSTRNDVDSVLSIDCGDHIWTIKTCSIETASFPAICVDCDDPCSTAAVAESFKIAPCHGELLQSSFQILSLSLVEMQKPPQVKMVDVKVTETTLSATITLSFDGTVFCGIFSQKRSSWPTSTDQVLLQNRVGSSVNNVTTININGLEAASSYVLFIVTRSQQGAQMSLTQMYSTETNVTTACCRKLSVQLSSSTIPENQDVINFFTLSMSTAPESPISAVIQVAEVVNSSDVISFVPLSQNNFVPGVFSLSAPISTYRSSWSKLGGGTYVVSIALTGISASKYSVVFANNIYGQNASMGVVSVLSSTASWPAPLLSKAVYSNDGSFMTISFDGNTNRGGTLATFKCNELFDFPCAATSKCQWVEFSSVIAYVTAKEGCAQPGDEVTLAATAQVRAMCMSTTGSCPTQKKWPISPISVPTSIRGPENPASPAVVISSSNTVGSCTPLRLDVTSSTGNGGRPWLSRKIEVISSASDSSNATALLQTFLDTEYQLSPPTLIPYDLLIAGQSYNFIVTLCNFLGQCSQASKRVSILTTIAPTVSIPGSALRSTKRSLALSLSAAASVKSCDDSSKGIALSYTWSVYAGSSLDMSLVSTSKDPSKFALPAYSLSVNTLYKIVVAVSTGTATSEASAQVLVEVGSIVAVIKGSSSMKNLRITDQLTLDASPSYDEDIRGMFGTDAGLRFTWSCIQLQPVLNQSCGMVFDQQSLLQQQSNQVLKLLPVSSAADTISELTVTVTDATMSRSSFQRILVKVLPLLSPVLNVVSNSKQGVINSGQVLQLTGSVGIPSVLAANVTWSLDDTSDSLDLPTVAMSPLIARYEAKSTVGEGGVADTTLKMNMLYLGLKANTLAPGSTYTFVLNCQVPEPGISSFTSLTVTVNVAPLPGSFYVTPVEGYELRDSFTFVSSQWQDTDLPLTYQFSYITASGTVMMIRSRSESSYGSALLPAGSAVNGYAVECVGEIFDSLMGSSTMYDSIVVKVLDSTGTDVDEAMNELLQSSLTSVTASTSVDDIKQSTIIASYLLNKVNCSLAPNCTALNRQQCFRTSQTCGPCISSFYIGMEGDSNEACVSIAALLSGVNPIASSAIRSKSCINDCSGHGECLYYESLQGQEIRECVEGDLSCYAACVCDEGYAQSSDCLMSDAEIEAKQTLRSKMIENIALLTNSEDVSDQTVSSWISNLAVATQNTDELSSTATDTTLSLVDSIVQQTTENGLLFSTVSGVLTVMDSVMTSVTASELRRRRRQRRLGIAKTDDESTSASSQSVAKMSGLLKNFTDFVADQMLPGQFPVQAVESNFRLGVSTFDIDSDIAKDGDCAASIAVETPLSMREQLIGAESSKLTLPACSSAPDQSSTVNRKVSVVSTSATMYNVGSYLGDPLSLHLSSFPCDQSLNNCEVQLVIPRKVASANVNGIQAGEIDREGSEEMIELACKEDDWTVHQFTCPGNRNYTIPCNGTIAKITTRCPPRQVVPTCNFLNSGSESPNCMMLSFTETNVTCVCSLLPGLYSYDDAKFISSDERMRFRRRQLLNGNTSALGTVIPQGAFSVNYVSMLTTVADTFVATVISASKLNESTIKKGWQALVTVGTIFVVFIGCIFFAHFADEKVKKKVAVANESKSKSNGSKEEGGRHSLVSRLSFFGNNENDKRSEALKKIAQNKGKEKNSYVQMADQALPQVLISSKSLTNKVKDELKRHHRWLGVIFYFSRRFPRVLRVVSLATNIVCMLFIQSLTYNLTNGDDGSCERLQTETACLEPSSPYATGASKCYWTYERSPLGECKFVQPDEDLTVIIFVAIFSAVVSTPIALFSDWVIQHVLSAPTSKFVRSKSDRKKIQVTPASSTTNSIVPIANDSNGHRKTGFLAAAGSSASLQATTMDGMEANLAVVPTGGALPTTATTSGTKRRVAQWTLLLDKVRVAHQNYKKAADKDFHVLVHELKVYRQTLIDHPSDLAEFDLLWGLDPVTGDFKDEEHKMLKTGDDVAVAKPSLFQRLTTLVKPKKVQTVQQLLLSELEKLHEEYDDEKQKFQDEYTTEREKSKRLLFLFQKDLMPGISGQILESKDQRDEVIVKGVSKSAKILAWIFLAILNLSMLFYVFLFAVSQDPYRQRAWAKSFGMWLVIEVIVVSSFMVCFMHVFIPSITMKDVNKIRTKLVDSIVKYHKVVSEKEKMDQHGGLVIQTGKKLKRKTQSTTDDEKKGDEGDQQGQEHENEEDDEEEEFNTAKYLFLSYRLACLYPDMKVSQIIHQFSTPWPRQSYQHVTDMSKKYNRKFAALKRSASMVAMFFLSNLLTVPPAIQDMIMQVLTTTATGYTILLHIQLYKIYPVLIAIPTIFIAAVIHFFVQSNKAQSKVALAKMLQGAEGREAEDKEKKRQRREMKKKRREATTATAAAGNGDGSVVHHHHHRHEEGSDNDSIELSSDSDSSLSQVQNDHDAAAAESSLELSMDSLSAAHQDQISSFHGSSITAIPRPVIATNHVNRRQSIQQGIAVWQRVAKHVHEGHLVPAEESAFGLPHPTAGLLLPPLNEGQHVDEDEEDENEIVSVSSDEDMSNSSSEHATRDDIQLVSMEGSEYEDRRLFNLHQRLR